MAAFEEIDGRARFDEKKDLRRLLDGGKAGERLLDPVIEYPEVFAAQTCEEVTAVIGDNHPNVHAVNADANRLLRLLRIFLGTGERTHAERGGEEQCRLQKAKRVHRPAIQPTGPNGCLSNPSMRHSKS